VNHRVAYDHHRLGYRVMKVFGDAFGQVWAEVADDHVYKHAADADIACDAHERGEDPTVAIKHYMGRMPREISE